MFEHQRKREIADLAAFAFDETQLSKAQAILVRCDPHTFVIVAFSLISRAMDSGLRHHLNFASNKEQRALLEGIGPLASDSARLRLLKALGWIPAQFANAIDALRSKRNEVAHSIVDAAEIDISTLFPDETTKRFDAALDRMLETYNQNTTGKKLEQSVERCRFFPVFLAADVVEAVAFGPSKLRLGIDHNSIRSMGVHDEMPDWARRLRREVARAYLQTLADDIPDEAEEA